jgi:serine/threonine protein kinase/Tol biopolymer transport system component
VELKQGDILHERYRIESILGQGGMGAVYLARDLNLDQQVAVKVNRDPSEQASRQFIKEAQLLAALHHTSLPRVIDYFVTDMNQILVMDYIPGDDLSSLIKNEGAQPLDKVLGWVDQLGAALTYMHSQRPQVVHRDIKPGNVKLTPAGEAVLVDFGIAKAGDANQATATGATGYTPGFAPPEQISRSRTGPYSDQYSLAATIYQTLSGRSPEDGIQRGLGKEQLTPIRKLMPLIPDHVESALNRALSLRPEERFKDIDEFIQSMKDPEFVASAGPVVSRVSPRSGSRNRAGHKWIWLAGLGGLVLLLAGSAAFIHFLLPDLIEKTSQTPEPTVDFQSRLGTDVALSRISTQTQAAFLAGQTATALVPTSTLRPDKTILGGGGDLAFVSDRGEGKVLQVWTLSIYMDNQSQILTDEPEQLTFTPGDKTQPSWSPDGLRIVYVAPGGGVNGLDIWVMAADGSGAVDITNKPGDEKDPAWAGDGASIVYTKITEEGLPLLYLMRSDGRDNQLLSDLYQESQPTWSADKQWLVYVISAKDHDFLYMRNLLGGSLVPVAFDLDSYFGRLGEVANPVFSPDGQWIAYTRVRTRSTYVCTANFQSRGNDIQQLTTSGSDDWATWSVDNRWIAFQSARDGNPEIYLMTSSGQIQTRLTDDPARDLQPSWKPVP